MATTTMRRVVFLSWAALALACGDDEDEGGGRGFPSVGGQPETEGSGGSAGTAGTAGASAGQAGKSGRAGAAGRGGTGGAAGRISGDGGTGRGGAAGVGGVEGGTAGAGGAEAPSALAPIVRITSPSTLDDPNQPGTLVGDKVQVLCVAEQSEDPQSLPVNPRSVQISLTHNLGTIQAQDVASTQNALNPNEYQGTFLLTNVAHGAISMTCTASDTSKPTPYSASDTVRTFVDKGPFITVTVPEKDNKPQALRKPLEISFTVTPAPLTEADTAAAIAVDGVTVKVGERLYPISSPSADGKYQLIADLLKPADFPTAPTGALPYAITATNQRTPDPAVSTQEGTVLVDGDAPEIIVKSPGSGAMIGGQTTLVFQVADAVTGVNPSSVSVTINNGQPFYYDATQIDRWQANIPTDQKSATFSFKFSKADLQSSVAQASVTIDAADNAENYTTDANATNRSVTVVYYRDDQPPIVDLDPPNVRESKLVGEFWRCSASFDPLGDAASQGQVVGNARRYRALVWDRTNHSSTADVWYFAGVDPQSVQLYLSDEVTRALVIDSDGNGLCDDIAPPTANVLEHKQTLTAIPGTGASDYTAASCAGTEAPLLAGCSCGEEAQPPKHLCVQEASALTRVISSTAVGHEPVVYGISPTDSGGLECTGRYWELGSVIDRTPQEGWICLAARASDKVGNVGVSPPLVVCFDDPDIPGSPDCPASVPPTCTDGCTFPGDRLQELPFIIRLLP